MVALDLPLGRIMLELEYATVLERHTFRIHAQPVEPTPFGPDSDFAYLPYSTDLAAEGSVLGTLAAFGAVWAAYYALDWTLTLRAVWALVPDQWQPFNTIPTWAGLVGALSSAQLPGEPTSQRVVRINSTGMRPRRLWLRQLPRGVVRPDLPVTGLTGGIDDRDQAFVRYLSGATTALTAPDGTGFLVPASVRTWWDRPRAFPWTADALA